MNHVVTYISEYVTVMTLSYVNVGHIHFPLMTGFQDNIIRIWISYLNNVDSKKPLFVGNECISYCMIHTVYHIVYMI